MAGYKRKTYRKKGNTAWYNRKYSTLQLAQKAWQGVKYIKGLVNSERKHFDHSSSAGTAISWGGEIYPLTQIGQGDGIGARNGNSVLARSLYFQYALTANTTSVGTPVRVMLFRDTMNQGDTPAVSDILTSTYLSTANATLSPLNPNSFPRFQILYDKRTTISQDSRDTAIFKCYKKMMTHIRFKGVNGTDEWKNALYVLFISNEQTNYPTMGFVSRVGYYDN